MSRPDLPRASSATSGFFFCGSIELPVAKASSKTANPNSSVDHSTSSSPIRDRWTPKQGQVEEGLGHEVAVGHGVEGVLEPAGEPEVLGHTVRVEGQGRAGQGPGPEGRDVEPVDGGHQPVDVPGQGPPVGQQVMGQQDRLGPLQVGVAGQVGTVGLLGPGQQDLLEPHDLGGQRGQLPLGVEPEVGGDLVVAAPARVQLGADVAGDLGDPALHRRCGCPRRRGRTRTRRRPAPPPPGPGRPGAP